MNMVERPRSGLTSICIIACLAGAAAAACTGSVLTNEPDGSGGSSPGSGGSSGKGGATGTGQGGSNGTSGGSWTQIYGVRPTAGTCGQVSITEHVKAWAAAGMTLGNMLGAKILIETGGGTGSINFTTASVTAQ